MKSQIRVLAILSVLILAGAAEAQECTRPTAPAIPDGATADLKDMLKAKSAVEAFIEDSEAFLACIEKREKAALARARKKDEDFPAKARNALIKRYNAGVKTMKRVAAEFNAALKTFCKTHSDAC